MRADRSASFSLWLSNDASKEWSKRHGRRYRHASRLHADRSTAGRCGFALGGEGPGTGSHREQGATGNREPPGTGIRVGGITVVPIVVITLSAHRYRSLACARDDGGWLRQRRLRGPQPQFLIPGSRIPVPGPAEPRCFHARRHNASVCLDSPSGGVYIRVCRCPEAGRDGCGGCSPHFFILGGSVARLDRT